MATLATYCQMKRLQIKESFCTILKIMHSLKILSEKFRKKENLGITLSNTIEHFTQFTILPVISLEKSLYTEGDILHNYTCTCIVLAIVIHTAFP